MTNLIVCCDGTWDTADQRQRGVPTPSNVARLYNAVADADSGNPEQRKYYHSGVGTGRHWWQKATGGAMGIGLDKHIMSAYHWLSVNYVSGDQVFVFGFSRGAFTARSVVGMINTCGLLDLSGLADEQTWQRVEAAYNKCYRHPRPARDWAQGWPFRNNGQGVPIHFLGVWDTVGALGIPNDMAILNLLDDPARYQFLDTRLSGNVKHARQALALDERRASFTPTLWTHIADDQNVNQLWFPGVHCDVGGGYIETGLADGALKWMLNEAGACSLSLRDDIEEQLAPDFQGILHDSDTGLFDHLRTRPRSVPSFTSAQDFHESAQARHRKPPITQAMYWHTIELEPGESREVDIFAREHWNSTGVYLQQGARYEFKASGQWLDGSLKCGPEGTELSHSMTAMLKDGVETIAGKLEGLFRKFTKNEQADLIGTRREEAMPWGALVGAVGNGGNPGKDGSPQPHQTFLIGTEASLPQQEGEGIQQPGYLYGYMNDAWHFYSNNRGSVKLTVTRLS